MVALIIAALAAAPATAAPERAMVIVPGQQIGKIRIGMPLAQVRAVLGRPTLMNRRLRVGFTRYVEYDWGYGRWTVGFSGRGSAARASLIGTTVRSERTRERVGVGTLQARVQAVYGTGLRCPRGRRMSGNLGTVDAACRLTSRSRTLTYFPTQMMCTDTRYGWNDCPTGKHAPAVYEVLIRSAIAPAPLYH